MAFLCVQEKKNGNHKCPWLVGEDKEGNSLSARFASIDQNVLILFNPTMLHMGMFTGVPNF